MKYHVEIYEDIVEVRVVEVDADSPLEAHRLAYEQWVEKGDAELDSVNVNDRSFILLDENGLQFDAHDNSFEWKMPPTPILGPNDDAQIAPAGPTDDTRDAGGGVAPIRKTIDYTDYRDERVGVVVVAHITHLVRLWDQADEDGDDPTVICLANGTKLLAHESMATLRDRINSTN